MDPFAGIFPQQGPISIYRHLKTIRGLGIAEIVLGCLCAWTEIIGLTIHITLGLDNDSGYRLAVDGIIVGVFSAIAGTWGFLTQLALVKPRARHAMFLLGILVTLTTGILCSVMLIRTQKEYCRMTGCANSTFLSSKNAYARVTPAPGNFSGNYSGSTEEAMGRPSAEFDYFFIAVPLLADATWYLALLLVFLASFFLNCENIRHIMKTGQCFLPHFKMAWLPKELRRVPFSKKKKRQNLPNPLDEKVVIDKDGSMWILPPDPPNETLDKNGEANYTRLPTSDEPTNSLTTCTY